MQLPGLLTTISIVSGMVLAFPMALIGWQFLGQGRTLMGISFIGLGVALLFLPEYVIRRVPRPWAGLKRRFSRSEERDP